MSVVYGVVNNHRGFVQVESEPGAGTSFIVYLLRPYHRNFGKRLIKNPKLHFLDSGLLSFLLQIRSPTDLEPLSRLLEKWFRLAFHEVLPGVEKARDWVSPDRAALMRAWGAAACPDCGKHSLPRVGEVGLPPFSRTVKVLLVNGVSPVHWTVPCWLTVPVRTTNLCRPGSPAWKMICPGAAT